MDYELWYAPYSATLTSQTITVTFGGNVFGALIVQGYSGVCASGQFDPHAPAITFNAAVAGVVSAGTQTTSNAHDLLFAWGGVETSGAFASGINAGTASTVAANANQNGGNISVRNQLLYLTPATTTTQSGTTSETLSASVTFTGAIIGDALTSDCVAASGGGIELPLMGISP